MEKGVGTLPCTKYHIYAYAFRFDPFRKLTIHLENFFTLWPSTNRVKSALHSGILTYETVRFYQKRFKQKILPMDRHGMNSSFTLFHTI